jgi:hypothetical protein
MKKTVILLLGLSVALNFVLLGFFIAGGDSRPAPAPAAAAPVAAKAADPVIDGAIWSGLKAETLPEFVRNLREAGFPPEVVRAIATARIDEIFTARINALIPDAFQGRTFWKFPLNDSAVLTAAMKIERERELALREALGSGAAPIDAIDQAMRGRRLDMLPTEKAAAVERIFREFDDKVTDLRNTGAGSVDRDKTMALEKAQREAIARLLTPQELEEFDLRDSFTSRQLRTDLSAFSPTEAEFRALYRLRQPFDEQFNLNLGSSQTREQAIQRQEAQKLLNDQIKATLGPERYAEYERSTDYGYRQTSLLVSRLELPPATTNQLWSVQKDLQSRAQALMQDRALPAETRNQQLATLQSEAMTKLTPLLGSARNLDAYKQYGGSWLQSLQPRQPAPPLPPRP